MDIIVYGEYELILEDHEQIFSYLRKWGKERLLVIANFFGKHVTCELPAFLSDFDGTTLISNYKDAKELTKEMTLRPYEAIVYYDSGN